VRRSRELHSTPFLYSFDSIERMAPYLYLTDQGILPSSAKTTGITATHFKIGDVTYKLFDIGDQKGERRTCIRYFKNIAGLLFLANMSKYDQVLYGDESVVCSFSLVAFLSPLMTFPESYSRSSNDLRLHM